jgi:hypothetical protein
MKKLNVQMFLIIGLLLISCNDASKNKYFSVTYNGNGNTAGNIPIDDTNYEQGMTVSVLGNSGYLLKINVSGVSYKFVGWNTQVDGNGTMYSQSQTFVMGYSNVTLHAIWLPYSLRDVGPAGGLIFYDKWTYSNGWRYLEAAPIDQSSNSAFSNVTYALANTSFDIGTGALNTINIINQIGHTTSAAKICADYSIINGVIYDDWFLPSRFELAVMLQNLAYGLDGYGNPLIPVGNFVVGSSYWSSSDYYGDLAWFQNGGVVSSTYKTTKMNVRAVRSF